MKRITLLLIGFLLLLTNTGCGPVLPPEHAEYGSFELLFDLPDGAVTIVSEEFRFDTVETGVDGNGYGPAMQFTARYVLKNDGLAMDLQTLLPYLSSIPGMYAMRSMITFKVDDQALSPEWAFMPERFETFDYGSVTASRFLDDALFEENLHHEGTIYRYDFLGPDADEGDTVSIGAGEDSRMISTNNYTMTGDDIWLTPKTNGRTAESMYVFGNPIEFTFNYDSEWTSRIISFEEVAADLAEGEIECTLAKQVLLEFCATDISIMTIATIRDSVSTSHRIVFLFIADVELPGQGTETTIEISYPIWPSCEAELDGDRLHYDIHFDTQRYVDTIFPVELVLEAEDQVLESTYGNTAGSLIFNPATSTHLRLTFMKT